MDMKGKSTDRGHAKSSMKRDMIFQSVMRHEVRGTSNKKVSSLVTRFLLLIMFFFFLPIIPSQFSIAAEEVKEVALDFDDVDIRLFIKVISELTGKNFVVDNNVRGKVTVLSPKKLTTQQAYEVFKSVLSVNGFAIIEAGQITKIVPAQNMSGYELPLSTKKVLKGEDQYITQIMPIKYLDANGLLPLIKPLLSRQGTLFAPPSSDLLIVTDTKGNIRKVDEILNEIDIDIADEIIERIDLKYSTATIVSSSVTDLLSAKYGKARKGTKEVIFKIVPLDRINALMAVASPDVMPEIRRVISKMDQPTPEGKSQLHVYYLENADAEEMVKILTQTQKAMIGAPEKEMQAMPQAMPKQKTEAGGVVVGGTFRALGKDITITADKGTNSIIIYASPDDYASLKEMIQKLDIPRKQVFIQALIMEVSPNEDFNFGTEWSSFKDMGHPYSDNSRAGMFFGA
ncbi:MAG: secretin N-terminal domain-containing protein, partial [Pseudomonadota bacterium]